MLPNKPPFQKSNLFILTALLVTLFFGWLVINSQAAAGDIITFLPLILKDGEAQPTSTPTATTPSTNTPTGTPSSTTTATATATGTSSATVTATPTTSHTSTPTATTQATNSPTPTVTGTSPATHTPTLTPTPSTTPTHTPVPSPTATTTPINTATATPTACPIQFEQLPIGGNDFVLVTGEPGSIVTIIDLTTGGTLGSDILIEVGGHACPGFADFSPPNQLSPPLIAGHVLLAQSSDGTFDIATILGDTATPTPTTGSTATPSPSPTITSTPDPAFTATFTPTPQNTPTPTNTPFPTDLVVVGPPQLIGTQPISVAMPVDFQIVMTNTGQTVHQLFFVDLFFNPTAVTTTTIPITNSNGYAGFTYFEVGTSKIITITSYLGFTEAITTNTVYAMVDSLQTIVESNEGNNITDELLVEVSLPPAIPPLPTPGVTPSPTPSAPNAQTSVSGIVRRLEGNWLPQFRAYVILIEQISGNPVQTAETDSSGYYEFNNVPAGSYSVKACLRLDGVDYVGIRSGIIPIDPFANVYMLPGPCT